MILEYRGLSLAETKLASVDDEARTFSGYGSVYGVVDSYGDVIAPGAFDETLSEHRARGTLPHMFLNHDMYDLPIGKYLNMEAEDFGLKVEGKLSQTSRGNDAYISMKDGILSGLSIGFHATDYEMHSEGPVARTIKKVDLVEVSPVTMPANQMARINDVKSAIQEGMSIRDLETLLRRYGVSRTDAVAIAAQFESKRTLEELETHRATLAAMDRFITAARR